MMDKPLTLRTGDRIRLLRVPDSNVTQREREIATNTAMAGWTADTIERIIALNPVVTTRTDEYGTPWFEADLEGPDGTQYHSLALLDDESWEPCE